MTIFKKIRLYFKFYKFKLAEKLGWKKRLPTVSKEMYKTALELVFNANSVSAAYLQRKMFLKYGQAAKLVDLLEKDGLISPPNSNQRREVYYKKIAEYLENDWVNYYHPKKKI